MCRAAVGQPASGSGPVCPTPAGSFRPWPIGFEPIDQSPHLQPGEIRRSRDPNTGVDVQNGPRAGRASAGSWPTTRAVGHVARRTHRCTEERSRSLVTVLPTQAWWNTAIPRVCGEAAGASLVIRHDPARPIAREPADPAPPGRAGARLKSLSPGVDPTFTCSGYEVALRLRW